MSLQTLSANINNSISGVAFNDIYLDGNGNISLSFDLTAVLQACSQASQTLLGECIYNINLGVPYEQALWIGVPNFAQFNASLRIALLQVPGVIEVVSLITSQNNNTYVYNAMIRTIYGNGVVTNDEFSL